MEPQTLSVRTSLAWSYGSQAAAFCVTFTSSVIVARLLSPREMGVYAMAFAVSGVVTTFTTFGVGSYVVREKELTHGMLRGAHTANAMLAIVLTAALLAISFVPGLLEADVRGVLRLVALNPVIGLFEFTPWALSMREGRFGLFAVAGTLRNVVNALATIGFAFAGFGASSLALGLLVGYAASVLTYVVTRPRDMMVLPTFHGLRPILAFGVQMISIGGAAQLAQRASDLILGKFLGLAALGLYSRASNLSYQIHNNVYGLATNVLFSKMSDELRTTGSLHRVYMRALAIMTAVLWPLLMGVAVLARPFLFHLYGDKWLGAAMPLTFLMLAHFVTLGFGMSWELFVLRGETARQTRMELVRAVVGTTAFAIGAAFSITGAAIGRVAEALFGYALYRPHMDRLADAATGELERVYGRGAALTVAAVAPSFLLMLWTDWSATTNLAPLIAAVALGGALWVALLAWQHHPLFEEGMRMVARFRPAATVREG